MAADEANEAVWFSVRCLLQHDGGFEERMTLWRALSFEAARAEAEDESQLYGHLVGARHVGVVGSFCLAEDSPGQGSELFSLRRDSPLSAEDYLSRFLLTGAEHSGCAELL